MLEESQEGSILWCFCWSCPLCPSRGGEQGPLHLWALCTLETLYYLKPWLKRFNNWPRRKNPLDHAEVFLLGVGGNTQKVLSLYRRSTRGSQSPCNTSVLMSVCGVPLQTPCFWRVDSSLRHGGSAASLQAWWSTGVQRLQWKDVRLLQPHWG